MKALLVGLLFVSFNVLASELSEYEKGFIAGHKSAELDRSERLERSETSARSVIALGWDFGPTNYADTRNVLKRQCAEGIVKKVVCIDVRPQEHSSGKDQVCAGICEIND